MLRRVGKKITAAIQKYFTEKQNQSFLDGYS
jgi:hypothetical protein